MQNHSTQIPKPQWTESFATAAIHHLRQQAPCGLLCLCWLHGSPYSSCTDKTASMMDWWQANDYISTHFYAGPRHTELIVLTWVFSIWFSVYFHFSILTLMTCDHVFHAGSHFYLYLPELYTVSRMLFLSILIFWSLVHSSVHSSDIFPIFSKVPDTWEYNGIQWNEQKKTCTCPRNLFCCFSYQYLKWAAMLMIKTRETESEFIWR